MNGLIQGFSRLLRHILLILGLILLSGLQDVAGAPSLAETKAAAEAGNAQAQDKLAGAYQRQLDTENAVHWYRKAAAQGVANSQYQLGRILMFRATSHLTKLGSRTATTAEAFDLLRRAAHQDIRAAQLQLGRLYEDGRMVSQDYVEAYMWFSLAARGAPLYVPAIAGHTRRNQLILKMSQQQIAEGEARVAQFLPGRTQSSKASAPTFLKDLKLQGLSGSEQRRLALISGQTFEVGEAGRVKIGDMWVSLRCLEITTNSARVEVEGVNAPVELQLGKAPVVLGQSRKDPVRLPPSQTAIPKRRAIPVSHHAQPKPVQDTASPALSVPSPGEVVGSFVRKLAWVAAACVGLVVLAVVGFVVVIPRGRKTMPSPPRARARSDVTHVPQLQSKPSLPPTSVNREGLMQKLWKIDWFQFEKLVAIVYRKQGCQVECRGGANPDGGIDLVLKKNGQRCAVQCKQWRNAEVGVKPVREFLGALKDAGIEKGIFVTLSSYTDPARQLADKHGIKLIDGIALEELLLAVHANYDPEITELLDDQRKFCPKCESRMVLRKSKNGHAAGSEFWGCSRYPKCRFTLQK